MRGTSSTFTPGTPTRSFRATRRGGSATHRSRVSSSRADRGEVGIALDDQQGQDPMRSRIVVLRLPRVPVCPTCGKDNPSGFAFCGYCRGSLATASDQTQERKLVTILFADLAGSTEFGSLLD